MKKRPSVTVRARTDSHVGVVPTTDEVQVCDPAASAWFDVEAGATAATSGAMVGLASICASPMVRVVAEP